KIKIVAIDDFHPTLTLISNIFKNIHPNYEIIKFDNGANALEFINNNYNDINLILLDIILPDISGFDLCRTLKNSENTKEIPIVMITAKSDSSDKIEGFEAGADDYIPKPFNEKELIARVNLILKNQLLKKHLYKQNQKLQKLNEIKDIFLSIASHDIRNNLTGIIGHCYLIQMQKYGQLDNKYLQSLKIILKRCKSISQLVDNIIDAAKLEAGKLVLNAMMSNFSEFLRQYYFDIITLYSYEEYKFKLIVEIPEDLEIYFDSQKIDEVFTNLVNNALKFSNKNSEITIGVKDYNDDYIKCFVADNGVGIKAEDIPHLFDKFTAISSKNRAKKMMKSSGLGLSICKGIVEAHSGKIWVASEENKGSTFYFTLPKREELVEEKSQN
ncbi:MAG TPA: ATP-binding protein, partial [bacterium]|nr:ATP-binding protein [bacterium]